MEGANLRMHMSFPCSGDSPATLSAWIHGSCRRARSRPSLSNLLHNTADATIMYCAVPLESPTSTDTGPYLVRDITRPVFDGTSFLVLRCLCPMWSLRCPGASALVLGIGGFPRTLLIFPEMEFSYTEKRSHVYLF